MSQVVVSILDPLSTQATSVVLGRRAFLREMALALLTTFVLPSLVLIGAGLHARGAGLDGLAISGVLVAAITAMPLLFYASLRLNAATLARERAISTGAMPQIYPPMQGPLFLRRAIVAGSVRSRILGGFPSCLSSGMTFAVLAYLVGGSGFAFLLFPLGVVLAVQFITAAKLVF